MRVQFNVLVILLGLLSHQGRAQDLTHRDSEEIKLLAQRKIEKGLNDLLNTLTFDDLNESERKAISTNSYQPSNNRIFYDGNVIIEDDIDPAKVNSEKVLDLKADKYLNNLDLFYAKQSERTIDFSDISLSNVKQTPQYKYIKVFYTSHFKGKHTQNPQTYQPIRRVAELRAEKNGKKWVVAISRLAFWIPEDSVNVALNDVVLPPSADSLAVLQDDAAEKQRQLEREQERQELISYNTLMSKADQAFTSRDYETALELYTEADKRNQKNQYDDLFPSRRLIRINKIITQQKDAELIREYGIKAEIATKRRNYAEAISFYYKLLEQKPDSVALTAIVKELTPKANIKAEYDERYTAGDYKELVREYDRIIKKEKDNSDWYFGRGRCYIKLGDTKAAMKDFSKSIELDIANLPALLARADLYKEQSNYPKAITDYSAYLNIDPNNAEVFAQRAVLRIRTNNHKNADEDLTRSITLNPEQPQYFFDRGHLRYELGMFQPAVDDFTNVIKLSPTHSIAYFWRGMAYVGLTDYGQAGADFTKAKENKLPDNYTLKADSVGNNFYAKGFTANQEERYADAVPLFNEALSINPLDRYSLYERGRAYLALTEYPKALDDLTATLELNPQYNAAYHRRAEVWHALKKHENAAADYKKSYELFADDYKARLGESTMLAELNKFSEAIPILMTIKTNRKKIEKLHTPDFFRDSYNLLGKCEFETAQFDKSVEDYDTALDFDKNFAQGYYNRGEAYQALGKLDRAIDDYQRSIDLAPAIPARYFSKAYALEKKGDYQKALDSYKEVVLYDSARVLFNKTVLRRGNTLFLAGQYHESILDLERVDKFADSTLCGYDCWMTLGIANIKAGKPDSSLVYFEKCLASRTHMAEAAYATACANLLQNKEADALKWFEKAFSSGNLTVSYVRKDKLLDTVRKDFKKNKSFKQLTDKYLK
ncbi:tetratricopeptide repeat protein [Dyadobacter jiangsuensis]|uniref:Tfp pilus assembly protein PilF n=1 Tax=Dyadobacter jiangsuensis TaxID=1591085 RepID=A0A2P8G0F3_9BACT|nr:tetratricopeptide repeat protein [Dyadobacter jiangsuensis]PSL27452.1 Tfp pilus assembly protein PilF [Dyadobacter jiangsuensis]